MHRRTLSLYSHLLLGKNSTSVGTVGRYGRSPRLLLDPIGEFKLMCELSTAACSTRMANAKSPVTAAAAATALNTKEQLGLTPKETLIKELIEEIPAKDLILKSKVVQEGKSWKFAPSVGNIRTGNKWDTEPFPALLESQILKAQSPAELLELAESPTIILKHACIIISRMGQLSFKDPTLTFESMMVDPRFVRICNLIQRGNFSQHPQSLFLAIHGLQNLGVSSTKDIFKTLGGELKWAMRRCPVRFLARAIELFSDRDNVESSSPQEKKSREEVQNILETAIETLQRRWVEVTSGNDFIAIFKILNFLNAETRGKLEDRAVEMVPGFYPQEMRKMFIVLGGQKRRPTPLLRALAFHLSKSEDRAAGKDLIDLTYALNELTFADPILMERVCSDLCPEIPAIENPALISSLVTSLGQMRYKHKGLLQIIDEWIITHLEKLRPFDCAAWLLTCAVLNYHPRDKDKFFAKAKPILSAECLSNYSEWINIVHALVILNEHSAELLASALKPEIAKEIDELGVKSSKTKVKLLNLNALAKSKSVDGYKGPFLDSKYEKQWSAAHLGPSDPKLSAVVLESLGTFLPTGKYLKVNQKLESGVFLDAVCFLNEKMDPVPATTTSTGSKILSLAFIVEGYSSMCRGIKDPTGSSILSRNILQSQGYCVISVPYTEFNATDKLVRRVQYLEQKIKSVSTLNPVEKSNR